MKSHRTSLNRYTTFSSLIHMLMNKKLTLLDPSTWDDKNDSYFLAAAKKQQKMDHLWALCFSEAHQTYHHWSVFAKGSDGVCISFKRSNLKDRIEKARTKKCKFEFEKVRYLTGAQANSLVPFDNAALKFTKNVRYSDEKEWRLVCASAGDNSANPTIKINISDIKKITVSPWLHKSLFEPMVEVIRSIDGCQKIDVRRSTLIDYSQWKSIADRSTI